MKIINADKFWQLSSILKNMKQTIDYLCNEISFYNLLTNYQCIKHDFISMFESGAMIYLLLKTIL